MKNPKRKLLEHFEKLSALAAQKQHGELRKNLNKARKAYLEADEAAPAGKNGTANLKALSISWEIPGLKANYWSLRKSCAPAERRLFEDFFDLLSSECDRVYWRRKPVGASDLPAVISPVCIPGWDLPEPEYGAVLMVQRPLYQHYAVYIGNGLIMHYAAEGSDFGGAISIHQAPLADFAGGSHAIYALEFPLKPGPPAIRDLYGRLVSTQRPQFPLFDLFELNYRVNSPAETVARAYSREGESTYFLPGNNCEHFALWCKTGVAKSHQVNAYLEWLLSWLMRTPIRI